MTALEHITQLIEKLEMPLSYRPGYQATVLYEVRRELPKIERKMKRELSRFTSAPGKRRVRRSQATWRTFQHESFWGAGARSDLVSTRASA